ncbi:unnamed protein product [Caretta caretta]
MVEFHPTKLYSVTYSHFTSQGIAMENVFFLVCSFKDPSYSGSRAACLLETEVCVSASVGKLSQLCRACFFPLKSLTLART